MPRPFKIIELLTTSKLRKLEQFCREQYRTIDQIRAWVKRQGVIVSRNAANAWYKRHVADKQRPHTLTCPHCKKAIRAALVLTTDNQQLTTDN